MYEVSMGEVTVIDVCGEGWVVHGGKGAIADRLHVRVDVSPKRMSVVTQMQCMEECDTIHDMHDLPRCSSLDRSP